MVVCYFKFEIILSQQFSKTSFTITTAKIENLSYLNHL
jgi:hypothetical protein